MRFRELFSSVHTLVDMRTFYDIYRPLLGGAQSHPLAEQQITVRTKHRTNDRGGQASTRTEWC